MDQSKESYRKCGSCGWIHMGVSRDEAEETIREFNKMYATLDESEQKSLYGGQPANLASYMYCINCHASYKEMVLLEPRDFKRMRGKNLSPILTV